jgi:hypothetical protein
MIATSSTWILRRAIPLLIILAVPAVIARTQPRWLTAAASDSVAFLEHKSATSILLYESRDIRIDDDGHARTHVRLARKILTGKGVSNRDGYLVESESEGLTVRDVRGWKMGGEGKPEELEDEDVVRIAPPGMEAIFSHTRLVLGGFAGVAFGDIVGFEYDIDDQEPYATYQSHIFQTQQPVRHSAISLTVPEGWSVRASGWNLDSIRYERNGDTRSWVGRDLPYRPEEPMMPSWSFLEKELRLTISGPAGSATALLHPADWTTVADRAAAFNDAAVERTSAIKALADSLTAGDTTNFEKIQAIASWVQSKVRYVAVEIGPGRWEPHSSSSVLVNSYGDCKDKVALFRSLLGEAGIPSAAVLANTGSYVDSTVPSLFQFNHVIAAIPESAAGGGREMGSIGANGWIFFDPTDPAQPFGMLPPALRGNRALVLAAGGGGIVRLPYGDPAAYRRYRRAEITITPPDTLRVNIRMCEIGPLAYYMKYYAATTPVKDRLEAIRSEYARRFRAFLVSDYSTSSSGDSAWTGFVLTVPGAFREAGGRIFLKANLFPLEWIAPLTSPARTYPVWFGGPGVIEAEVFCNPGEGWVPTGPPSGSVDSCLDAASLGYSVSTEGGRLRIRSAYSCGGRLTDAEEYPHAKAFSRSVQNFNDLTITLQRIK